MNAGPVVKPVRPPAPQLDANIEMRCELQRQEFARRHIRRQHAFTLIWPLVCRRLEERPNMNATELFDELRVQYPGRFHRGQLRAFAQRVGRWRDNAGARDVVIGPLRYRQSPIPRTRRRPDPLQAHWAELCEWLSDDPDQTGSELFTTLRTKYPDCYTAGQLRTLQRRLKIWRHEAVQPLICEMQDFTQDVGCGTGRALPQA
jgi:hypothetical protein